jgi:hypothetical protein
MLDALPLFLSLPVFQGVIIEELFPINVVLAPEVEPSLVPVKFDSFLLESACALTLNVHAGVIARIINTITKDITKTNLLFIVIMHQGYQVFELVYQVYLIILCRI